MPMQGAVRLRLLQPLLLASVLLTACAASADWRYTEVSEVFAVSDIHGAAGALERTLQSAGVIDATLNWHAGNGHLVITGDVLDRGADSRAALDLLMRLEKEARQAGGELHLLLGNHEVMNLVGDLRYVAPGEYAAFAGEETQQEREHWFGLFAARNGGSDISTLREQFDRARPPGFFAHRRAFAPDGHYGSWLLQKPVLIVINGTAFTHGGLSPEFTQAGLAALNQSMRDEARDYVEALSVLQSKGFLLPGDNFYTHTRILEALPEDADFSSEVAAAMDVIRRQPEYSIHDTDGPLWYRGNVGCPDVIEMPRLAAALENVGAERLVIGHTPTSNRAVVSRLGGRIFEIDTGMQNAYYGGSGHVLSLTDDSVAVVGEAGDTSAPLPDERLSGVNGRSEAEIEVLLQNGAVTLQPAGDDGRMTATVAVGDDGGQSLPVLFLPLDDDDLPAELIAYRIDRLLGLQMVPVTVARSVAGRPGLLQLRSDRYINEQQRRDAGSGSSAWCPLPLQWQSMYLFDALILKNMRSVEQILYDRSFWQLVLTGHDDAFSTKRGLPAYLRNAELTITPAWRDALSRITDEWLTANLGEQLDKRRRRALLRRRDDLLKLPDAT